MVKQKTKKLINKIAYWTGALIVIGTHTAILVMGGLPEGQWQTHAIINLTGAGLYAYARFVK